MFDDFLSGAGSVLSNAANRWIDQEFAIVEPPQGAPTQYSNDPHGNTYQTGMPAQWVPGVSNATVAIGGGLVLVGLIAAAIWAAR